MWALHRVRVRAGWGPDVERPLPTLAILGMLPQPGTLAPFIVVPRSLVYPAPPHLTDAQAASLPLAGLTAYRSVVTAGGVTASSTVLVTGIGGGVALFALQFALALGVALRAAPR